MPQPRILSTIAVASLLLGMSAQAGGHGANPAVAARQGHMQIMSLNIGILGQMARGNTEYNAESAAAAASNLALLGMVNQMAYWPEGTDSDSIEGTRALPAIWENIGDVIRISQEYASTTAALSEVAGNGLDEMRAALGPVGATCGACHDDYRQPR